MLAASLGPLVLTACDQAGGPRRESAEQIEAATTDMAAESVEDGSSDFSTSLPQLAYEYGFTFALPGEDLRRLQRQHATLCEQQGPQSCVISGLSTHGSIDDNDVTGELQMLVATRHARAFGALLEEEAEGMGAEQLSADISTDEVSRQLTDSEAYLASRIELRDRLREVRRTRSGSVEELVQAERELAAVQQEIDAARSTLSQTQGRVAMSRMTVSYESTAPVGGDFLAPVRGAMGSVGTILGTLLAIAILLAAVGLPLLGAALGLRWAKRRLQGAPAEA
ncbi:DUF4349 domain-containing protein [Aurantiacibacter luteus]|nr:DUF4349 domain-containing protein [Aurantiacibacter luteus]